jgi:DNA-binding NtrC family response regulator
MDLPAAVPPDIALKPRILVVDDDRAIRTILERALSGFGFEPETAASGEDALRALATIPFDLVLLDLELPGLGGLEILALAPGLQADAPFIILTGSGAVGNAVEAMKLGAYDYILKPPNLAEIRLSIDHALADRDRRRELARLRLMSREGGPSLIGESVPMQRLRAELARVAPTRANVLITGETGTGKEMVAQTVHALSDRASKPFVPVDCSALPEGLLESELFGHLRGSFTGAVSNRRGVFEEAADGTLFLDEVGTLPAQVQVKLLRVLQERRVQRVGGGASISVAFRLIAATNVELGPEVALGRFREDLYFRLNVVPIRVPPLRDRGNDILLLAGHFRNRFAEEYGVDPPEFSPALVRRMLEHHWPGNVRQLENLIQRAVIMRSGGHTIPASAMEESFGPGPESDLIASGAEEEWSLDRAEREFILLTFQKQHGHVGQTAGALGIDRKTLSRKLKEYAEAGFLSPVASREH